MNKREPIGVSTGQPGSDTILLASIKNRIKRSILFTFITALAFYSIISIYFYGLSVTTIVLLIIGSIFVLMFRKTYRSISSAVIKGDTLILKNTENKASVTHIRSIRTIQTKRLAGKAFTSLNYKLDGISHRALLISDVDETDPPQLMIQRIQKELKKKKANL